MRQVLENNVFNLLCAQTKASTVKHDNSSDKDSWLGPLRETQNNKS